MVRVSLARAATHRDLRRLEQRKRATRLVLGWSGFALVAIVAVAVLEATAAFQAYGI